MQRRKFRLHALLLSSLLALTATPEVQAKPKTHTVYEGQRLGSIAKRYNVTVDELCRANGITPKSTIRPGQKLIIPGTEDGSKEEAPKKTKAEANNSTSRSKATDDDGPNRPKGKTQIHVVAKGHTLSAIAGRYAITLTSLCNANGLERNARLSVGQRIIIPHKTDKGGEYARKQRLRGDFDEKVTDEEREADNSRAEEKGSKSNSGSSSRGSWEKYVKPPWRRGFIKIRRYGRYWEGYVIGPEKQVLGQASNKINFVLGASSDGPHIDPKLIRLIASVSDKFGGRELRIVSGYRTKSFVAASKHKAGKALDFSIPGVPNEALRDYLRTIDNVGVGYYPNSSFVHLDVRGYNSYWIDRAGPGEAPQIAGKSRGKASKKTKGESGKKDTAKKGSSSEVAESTKEPTSAPSADENSDEGEEPEKDASEEEVEHDSPISDQAED